MYNPHLKTFFAVIETGSFSKAAEQLFLTPSAVLHQIRALWKRTSGPSSSSAPPGASP